MPQENRPPKAWTQTHHRPVGTWVFGGLLLTFIIGVFIFAPPDLPEFKHRLLAICAALLAGFFAYFLTGDLGIEIKSLQSRFGDMVLKAAGGLAMFVLVLLWWLSPLAPVAEQATETEAPPEVHEQPLAGAIRDEANEPVAEVQVSLPAYGVTTTTNALGSFHLQVEAPDQATVELLAQKRGYRTHEQYATLGNTGLSFTLRGKE
jgi:hypothetical protein